MASSRNEQGFKHIMTPKKDTITITPPSRIPITMATVITDVFNRTLVGGVDYYIGWDNKAHFVGTSFGPAPIATNPNGIKSKLSRDYLEESDVDKYLTFKDGTDSNIDPVLKMRLAAYARDNETTLTITSAYR